MLLRHLVPWPSIDIHVKFYEDRPRGIPPLGGGGLNTRGVAKYSDSGAIEGHILETVQDRLSSVGIQNVKCLYDYLQRRYERQRKNT